MVVPTDPTPWLSHELKGKFDEVIEQLAAIEEIIAGADRDAAGEARIASGRILAQQKGARRAIPAALQKRLSTELMITAGTVEKRIAAAAGAEELSAAIKELVADEGTSTAADWVITRTSTSDETDVAPSYWAGGQVWLSIEAEMLGIIRTFESAAEAKATYRTAHGSFPRTYSMVQLTAEQIAAIEATAADAIARWVAEQPGTEIDAGAELDTVVDAEIVEALNEDAAQDLDGRIRTMAAQVHDDIETLEQLVIEARAGQIHRALGFASWPAYLADALRDTVHVDRAGRRELVGFLAGQNLANRAIAAIADVDEGTVRNDLKALRKNSAVDPAPARKKTGLDGKTRRRPTKTAAPKETSKSAAPQLNLVPQEHTTATPAAEGSIDSTIAAATEPPMKNFTITIGSDGTAALNVVFMGAEEPCAIPLGGRLDKRITAAVAADLGYHLGRASTEILGLLDRLDRRAKKAV